MKNHSKFILINPILLLMSACSPASKLPEVFCHLTPNLTLDTTWIESADCQEQETNSRYLYASCPENSTLQNLGCEDIIANTLLGGLPYPVASCWNYQYLVDNPVLSGAISTAEQVIPLFILDPTLFQSEYTGEKRLVFLFAGLRALDEDLRKRGSSLILRSGDPLYVLSELTDEVQAASIYAETDYSPTT